MNEISEPIGNIELFDRPKTAFLTSRSTPVACLSKINRWVESLSTSDDCVILGNLQQVEKDVVGKLIDRGIPVLLVLCGPYPKMWPTKYLNAVGDGRMLIVTTADFILPWVDKYGMASDRNKYIIANAQRIVVGMLRPQGILSSQIKGFDNVEILNEFKPEYNIIRR